MHILVLGGTLFLGRHVVDAALARGHRVTLFNRGTRPAHRPDVETLLGDRDGGLAALAGRRFDVVVDPSGYVPRLVGASVRLLADAVEHYTFVSSVSVYQDFSRPGVDESAAVQTIADETNEDVATHYGALKALSERAAEAALPGRVLVVRAGLLVGPCDPTGRFTYWVRRVFEGGDVLAPGAPGRRVQLIDARDVADWIVASAEARRVGVYNVAGPALPLTMHAMLEACRGDESARIGEARFVWVDDAFLAVHEVAPFTEMPLWLPPDAAGLLQIDGAKALAAGLTCRELAETVDDTARWLRNGEAPASNAGLTSAREQELLDAWRTAQGATTS